MIRHTFILVAMLASASALALKVARVEVECGKGDVCARHKSRFAPLKDEFRNTTHLRQTLKVLVSRGGVKDFHWELSEGTKEAPGETLKLRFTPKLVVGQVRVSAEGDDAIQDHVERNTRLRTDGWYDESVFTDEEMHLRQLLAAKGYPRAQVHISGSEKKEEMIVRVVVTPNQAQRWQAVTVKTTSKVVQHYATLKFTELLGRPMDVQEARARADEFEAELFAYGYYLASVNLTPRTMGSRATLEVAISPVELYTFDVRRPREDLKMEFGPVVRELFKRYRRPLDENALRVGILELLHKRGYLRPEIKVSHKRLRNKDDEEVHAFTVDIEPGDRTRVREVVFTGATVWSEKKLRQLWREQAQELAAAGFYDEDSNAAFSEWLRGQYIRQGYVRAEIPAPRFSSKGAAEGDLVYTIMEGSRVVVDEVSVTGVESAEAAQLLEVVGTKQGAPFNPFQFTEDVQTVTDWFQGKGWYWAEVVNRNDPDIVVYGRDLTSVKVHLNVRKGRYLEFNRLVVVGNRRTRTKVLRRKSPLRHGQPLTPSLAKEYETILSNTGLFASVRVRPIAHKGETPLTDVAVEVSERDYGLVELAPGYRTDIGLKLSGTVSYMNLFGANRSLSLTGQVNQRLDFQTFDERRREEGKRMLEYNLGTLYNQPDVFDSYMDYGAGLNFQRRRFFSFDADIIRLTNTFSRDYGQRYSLALRHQFERINQFDATQSRDNGSFTIGALTPSFTADFRNTRINPTAGAWFNVSNEWANPYFLSQKNDELEINFYKFISRNRFYVPIPNGTVAISMVGGIQENLAGQYKSPPVYDTNGSRETKGYIPNIKLFRLTGTDIVRGFSDEEINRLSNGNDIGEDRVQKRAYMANLKVEPRYFINDTMMTGVFFDAGRVYKDQVDIGDLRQSVGVTFKVVTPVGTLDFDYGVKLLRKRLDNGSLESPGRFHVSIGFF
jgi:outer membrane protein insertion porin family